MIPCKRKKWNTFFLNSCLVNYTKFFQIFFIPCFLACQQCQQVNKLDYWEKSRHVFWNPLSCQLFQRNNSFFVSKFFKMWIFASQQCQQVNKRIAKKYRLVFSKPLVLSSIIRITLFWFQHFSRCEFLNVNKSTN